MPLSEEQKRQYITSRGLNPDDYDVKEVTPEEYASLNAPVKTPEPSTISAPQAFSRSMLQSLVPSASALAGMRAAAALPIPHPIGKGAAIVIGGLLSSLAGSYGQNKVLDAVQSPEGRKETIDLNNQSRQQHPVLSTLGELAPSLLSFGPGEIKPLVTGVGKMLYPSRYLRPLAGLQPTVANAERQAMINAGANVAAQGGLEAGMELANEGEINPKRLATSAIAGGLLLNKPTRLGGKILGPYFNEHYEPTPSTTAESKPEITQPLPPKEQLRDTIIEQPTPQEIDPIEKLRKELQGREAIPSLVDDKAEVVKTGVPENILPPDEEGINIDPTTRFMQEATPKDQTQTPEFKRWFEGSKIVDNEGKPVKVYHGTNVDFNVFKPAKEGTLGSGIYATPRPETASAYAMESANAEKRASGNNVKQIYASIKNPLEISVSEGVNPGETALRKLGLSREKALQVAEKALETNGNLTNEVKGLASKNGYDGIILREADGSIREVVAFDPRQLKSATGNQGSFDPNISDIRYSESGSGELLGSDTTKAQELAAKRGVELKEEPEIISDVTNQPARGYSEPSTRKVGISDIATQDTPIHEIAGHQHLEDLLSSTHPEDVAFANRGLEAAGGKEQLAQAVGERGVEVQNKPLKTWLQDFYSNIKRTIGAGNEQDDIKLFTRRGLDDRPYSESPELHSTSSEVQSLKPKFFSEEAGEDVNNVRAKTSESATQGKGLIGLTTPLVDKLIAKGGSDAVAGKAYHDFEKQYTRNMGEITNPLIGASKQIKNKEEASRYIWESVVNEGGATTVKINPADKKIIDELIHPVYKKVQEIQNTEGLKIIGEDGSAREAKSNPNRRGPLMPNEKTLEALLEHSNRSVDRVKAEKQFIDFHVSKGDTKAQATEKLDTYLRGLSSIKKGEIPDFNALRRSEGVGIPWEWMEKDPNRLFQRYGNRVSRDLAFFKHVQNVPEVRKVFGFPDQFGKFDLSDGTRPATGSEVTTAKRRIAGEHTFNETLFNSIEHFTRSLILGPVTGAKNLIGTFQQLLPYVPVRDIPKVVEAFGYIKKGLADGLEKGVIRHSTTSMEVGATSEGFGNIAEKLKIFGDAIRHYTGANAIEQISRAHTMAVGELLTRSYAGRAAKGDIDAIKFLKQFAPDNFNSRQITEDVIKETAANFTERVQGTYGGRGLPSYLLEPSSPAYWLLSLSKWSIEKGNVIKQDVINPALNGDVAPLLRYTLGGLVTGEVISQIVQQLNNKKSSSPSLTELKDKGQADDWAYKATELMWLSGYGGILSDAAKMIAEKAKPYGRAQSPTIPSVEISKEIATNIAQASSALVEGTQNPVDVVMQLANDILVDNIQALRVVYNHTVGAKEMERADNFRDKRVYDKLNDKANTQAPDNIDRYHNVTDKKFKQASTIEEGKKIYKEDIEPGVKKLSGEDKKDRIESLKRNSYQVAPSDWRESEEYYAYIKRTQGVEAADKLRAQKKNQDSVNRQKSWLVH